MESAGRECGKETRKRPAGGAKRQANAKKILNRGNEPNKSFRINKSLKKRTQNELDFERKNAQITPKKRVLGGTFHVTGGLSVDFRFPQSLRLVAARPPHPSPSADGLKKAPARATLSPKGARAGIRTRTKNRSTNVHTPDPLPQGGEGWNPDEDEKSQHKCTNRGPSRPRGRG